MPGPRLLVVDDEPDILRTLELFLQRSLPDGQVRTAANGVEAIGLLEASPADLLITDYKMPKMDGLKLVVRVRERWPECQSILLTAYPDMAVAIEALNAGHIRQFFIKPVDPDKLMGLVKELLADQLAARQRQAALQRAAHGSRQGPADPNRT